MEALQGVGDKLTPMLSEVTGAYSTALEAVDPYIDNVKDRLDPITSQLAPIASQITNDEWAAIVCAVVPLLSLCLMVLGMCCSAIFPGAKRAKIAPEPPRAPPSKAPAPTPGKGKPPTPQKSPPKPTPGKGPPKSGSKAPAKKNGAYQA